MKQFPGTPTLKLYQRYSNLVIETKDEGTITIQKADLPEVIAAALTIAIEEGLSAQEMRDAFGAAGVKLLKI